MKIVIDASVIIKWYLPEIHSNEAELLVNDLLEIHAPESLITEFGNILWKKCKIGELSPVESLIVADQMLTEDITFHAHASLLRDSLRQANETGQTVYDWTYLILASSLGAEFVTADRKFFLAVRRTDFKNNIVWIENISSFL